MSYDRLGTKESREESRQHLMKLYNATAEQHNDLNCLVCRYNGNNTFNAFVFDGSAGKPSWHYTFKTEERRESYIAEHLAKQQRKVEYKAERKEQNKGHLTGSAATAQAIRERLKKEFPGVKFSVTSSNFSMGNSVDVSWTGEPVACLVDHIINQYQYGHFDGMNDSYEYHDISDSLGCPGAKYVSSNRHQTEERAEELKQHCINKYGCIPDQYTSGLGFNAWHYENANPETWKPEYQKLYAEQEAEQAEAYKRHEEEQRRKWEQEERQRKAEEAEQQKILDRFNLMAADPTEETRTAEQKQPEDHKVISFSDYRKQKQEVKEQEETKKAISEQAEVEMMLGLLDNKSLAAMAIQWSKKQDIPEEQRRAGCGLFLAELKERDPELALETFKQTEFCRTL
jgi:hypothetical protein